MVFQPETFIWAYYPQTCGFPLGATPETGANFPRLKREEGSMVREFQFLAIGFVFVFLGAIVAGVF